MGRDGETKAHAEYLIHYNSGSMSLNFAGFFEEFV